MPKAEGEVSMPDPLNLPVVLDIVKPKQNAVNMIALLHYELNEVVLGVSKSVKKPLVELPQLEGTVFWCLGPQNTFRLGC
jgi:hypothetical protein